MIPSSRSAFRFLTLFLLSLVIWPLSLPTALAQRTAELRASLSFSPGLSLRHPVANKLSLIIRPESGLTMDGKTRLAGQIRASLTDGSAPLATSDAADISGSGPYTIDFTGAQLNQPLGGAAQKDYWLVVFAVDGDGEIEVWYQASLRLTASGASLTTASPPIPETLLTAEEAAGLYATLTSLATANSTRAAADTALDARLDTLEAIVPDDTLTAWATANYPTNAAGLLSNNGSGTLSWATAFNPAIPGALGGTTPAAGSFTNLSASGTLGVAGTSTLNNTVWAAGSTFIYSNPAACTAHRAALGIYPAYDFFNSMKGFSVGDLRTVASAVPVISSVEVASPGTTMIPGSVLVRWSDPRFIMQGAGTWANDVNNASAPSGGLTSSNSSLTTAMEFTFSGSAFELFGYAAPWPGRRIWINSRLLNGNYGLTGGLGTTPGTIVASLFEFGTTGTWHIRIESGGGIIGIRFGNAGALLAAPEVRACLLYTSDAADE